MEGETASQIDIVRRYGVAKWSVHTYTRLEVGENIRTVKFMAAKIPVWKVATHDVEQPYQRSI